MPRLGTVDSLASPSRGKRPAGAIGVSLSSHLIPHTRPRPSHSSYRRPKGGVYLPPNEVRPLASPSRGKCPAGAIGVSLPHFLFLLHARASLPSYTRCRPPRRARRAATSVSFPSSSEPSLPHKLLRAVLFHNLLPYKRDRPLRATADTAVAHGALPVRHGNAALHRQIFHRA